KTQDQGKAQENDRPQGGQAQKAKKRQKNQADQNNAGEERAPAARESKAADTARTSTTDPDPPPPTRPPRGPNRGGDPLLQPHVSRNPAARVRYVARWRCDPHPRTHHRFQPEGRVP